jgi:hypothetical protein
MSDKMKASADYEDEWRRVEDHVDGDRNRMTPVIQFPPEVARAVVEGLTELVREGHRQEELDPTPDGEIRRAQQFEEGDVYMLESPFEGFFADRYLMDFYDVQQRDICSRMHMHTGLRFVRMMTGPGTTIRVSSLSPIDILGTPNWTGKPLVTFVDELPVTDDSGSAPQVRYNAVVPENTWVDLQVPRGVSHQFNAVGPNAVIDSVHPEESIETLREGMSGYKMMAQTIFLAKTKSPASTCLSTSGEDVPAGRES